MEQSRTYALKIPHSQVGLRKSATTRWRLLTSSVSPTLTTPRFLIRAEKPARRTKDSGIGEPARACHTVYCPPRFRRRRKTAAARAESAVRPSGRRTRQHKLRPRRPRSDLPFATHPPLENTHSTSSRARPRLRSKRRWKQD